MSLLEKQMFDPPYRRISIAGTPIFEIPNSEKKEALAKFGNV